MEIKATPLLARIQSKITKDKKILVCRGGTRSSKTYSIIQLAVIRLITGYLGEYYMERGKMDVVRKFSATLRQTSRLDFEEVKDDFLASCSEENRAFFAQNININKANHVIRFYGRSIHFLGADQWTKLKGAKRDILFCNEATELEFKTEFNQLLMRTTKFFILDFNPDHEEVWINTEIEQKRLHKRGDVVVDVSTYKDNPTLEQSQIDEIEYYEETDEDLWRVYGLGEYGKVKGRVFNFAIRDIPERAKFIGYGLDWGFSTDPLAVVAIYQLGKALYFDEVIYKRELSNKDLSDELEEMGAEKHELIVADNAEPKSINELHKEYKWRNIHPCDKGPGSIVSGIKFMKTFKLYLTPTSTNLKSEFKKYVRAKDKNGEILGEPIDKNNHGIDAIRYCVMKALGPEKPNKPNIR